MSSQQDSQQSTGQPSAGKRKRTFIRRFLLTLGPAAVAAATAYLYLTGGRYVQSDNAYVQADKVAISAEVSGSIVEVMVEENDFVEKGEPLFQLDDRSYAIALAEAEARQQEAAAEIRQLKARYLEKVHEEELVQSDIDFARKQFSRQSALDSHQAVAKAQLDDARHTLQVSEHRLEIIRTEITQILARLEGDPEIAADRLASFRLAEAMVDKAALDLARTTVTAPFSGRVSKVPQAGKHVQPGTPVMSLIADSSFWIEANLKETELTRVRPGQKVSIEVDTFPDQRFSGTVQSISPGTGSEFSVIPAQNASGNWVKVVQRVPVRISVTGSSEQQVLRSGMSTTVRIDTEYHRPLPGWLGEGLAALGLADTAAASEGNGR